MNGLPMKIKDILTGDSVANFFTLVSASIKTQLIKIGSKEQTYLSLILVTGLLPATICAADAELVARDIFLTLDSEPTGFSYTSTGPTGTRSGDDAFDSGLGLSLGLRWSVTPSGSPFGFIAGVDLGATNYVYQDGASNLTTGARIVLGAGWAINDSWEVLIEPTIEYGLARFNFPATQSYPSLNTNGAYLGYGLRANTIWHLSNKWALMGAVGWKQITNEVSGDGVDLKMVQSGPSVSLGILYRFSAAPTRIE
jgi:hypothetical protein